MAKLEGHRKSNRLASSTSPYLRLHAYDPVDWYPWGEEAIARAREEDKPILLSIGYSSCHWCHVMHRESFLNPVIADLINKYFVPVKVDREERPDIDAIYMRAVILMTGQGGWPLTVFLTPDLKPFFGGTYFPPERKGGLPGLKEVLLAVRDAWAKKRKEILENSNNLFNVIAGSLAVGPSSDHEVNINVLSNAYDQAVLIFDEDFGGIRGAPKFPNPLYHLFLLRYWRLHGEEMALRMVEKTLRLMWMGGIYDHVGGGFHRYAVDRSWSVPHFEKMLYDNAMLTRLYAEMYVATGVELYRHVATDIALWLLREMSSPRGGFCSALDSESGGREGGYYLYSWSEISSAVGEEVARILGCSPTGNFKDGLNIVRLTSPEQLAKKINAPLPEAIEIIRERLGQLRRAKEPPTRDDKVIASWNGLAIEALAYLGAVSRESKFIEAAASTADFILRELYDGEELKRYWLDGPSKAPGLLEDYSLLGCGLIELYQWTGAARYLEAAHNLATDIRKKFLSSSGGFYDTVEGRDIPLRPLVAEDNVYPSGYGGAVLLFGKLYQLTLEEELIEIAKGAVKCVWQRLLDSPLGHLSLISAIPFLTGHCGELVVVTPQDDPSPVLTELAGKMYEPYIVVSAGRSKVLRTLTEGKECVGGRPTFYLCKSSSCQKPTTEISELISQLRGFTTISP